MDKLLITASILFVVSVFGMIHVGHSDLYKYDAAPAGALVFLAGMLGTVLSLILFGFYCGRLASCGV